jgi:hypothetical protein
MTTHEKGPKMALQHLILTLDGINAGDYMEWVRDPEPIALEHDLRAITVHGAPLGHTVEAVLSWRGSPPGALVAASLAGLPVTADVVAVESRAPTSETVAAEARELAAAA